ncbi:MAG: hypothetical protein Tsb0020_41030 [Haliangiales bacterium]
MKYTATFEGFWTLASMGVSTSPEAPQPAAHSAAATAAVIVAAARAQRAVAVGRRAGADCVVAAVGVEGRTR